MTSKMKKRTVKRSKDKVLYARKTGEVEELPENLLTGKKISVEDAISLKTLCWGGPGCVPNPEWIQTGIVFHSPAKVHAFGLQLTTGAQKAFQVILQAYILKFLFFGSSNKLKSGVKSGMGGLRQRPSKGKPVNINSLLEPSDTIQRESLCSAMTEILWKVGESRAVIVIPCLEVVIDPPLTFTFDGVTEKLHCFYCDTEEEVDKCVKKHIYFFMNEKSGGLLCFLYSIILSKGFSRFQSEMQSDQKLPLIQQGLHDKISLCLSNAMLTGQATPYLFNGVQEAEYSEETQSYQDEKVGLLERNYIGFLIWDKTPDRTSRHKLGSRYKTPHLPIWVTSVNNQWGVLFNPRLDLMKSHSAENRFSLYYYSGHVQPDKKSETLLTVDTRDSKNNKNSFVNFERDSDDEEDEELEGRQVDYLAVVLSTKWVGCNIEWQKETPYV